MIQELFNYFLGAFTSLFSIIDPPGVMPVFLALTAAHPASYRNYTARKATIFMAGILIFFLFAGTFVMTFFGISLESLRVAGGIIIMRSGFDLLNANHKAELSKQSKQEALEKADISFTPLAMPLLSGPGSIAATISLATQAKSFVYVLVILLAILIICAITFLILRVSQRLLPYLGPSGLDAVSKIMGFIALTVGVQFILNGLSPFLAKVTGVHLPI